MQYSGNFNLTERLGHLSNDLYFGCIEVLAEGKSFEELICEVLYLVVPMSDIMQHSINATQPQNTSNNLCYVLCGL